MSLIRVLVGVVLGLVVACASIPAQASVTEPPAHATRVAPSTNLILVSGQSWSAPAYPVVCKQAAGQVSCTPTNRSEVAEQQCFQSVPMDGARTAVCTTYEGHVSAIETAGGRALVVEYGCSVGDVVCMTFENAGRGMALGTTAVMILIAANMRFDTSTVLWMAAVNEWSFWQWAVLVVVFGAMVWAIAAATISGNRDELVGAIVRTFIAIPAVPLTLWGTGHLLNAIDELTWYVMNRDGPATMFQQLQNVMWAGGHANYFFGFIIHLLLLVAMLLLMVVFAFRNIALAALIGVGPVAWMLFPVKSVGPQWVVRYVSAIVALLLAGPLTNGFVMLIVGGLADIETIWDPQSWPLLVGLVLAAFAPLAVFGLFNFVGTSASDAMGSRVGSSAGRAATGMARAGARSAARMPSRLTAHPAGRPRSAAGAPSTAAPINRRRGAAQRPAGAPRQARPTNVTTNATLTTPARSSSGTTPATTERPEVPSTPAPASAHTRAERKPS